MVVVSRSVPRPRTTRLVFSVAKKLIAYTGASSASDWPCRDCARLTFAQYKVSRDEDKVVVGHDVVLRGPFS